MTSARLRRDQAAALVLATAPPEEQQKLQWLHLQELILLQRKQYPSVSLGQLVTLEDLQLHRCIAGVRPNSK